LAAVLSAGGGDCDAVATVRRRRPGYRSDGTRARTSASGTPRTLDGPGIRSGGTRAAYRRSARICSRRSTDRPGTRFRRNPSGIPGNLVRPRCTRREP